MMTTSLVGTRASYTFGSRQPVGVSDAWPSVRCCELVSRHAQTLFAELGDADGCGLPRHVERELAEYLRRGILAHGFTRVRCQACNDEILVAFSCKRRGAAHAAGDDSRFAPARGGLQRAIEAGARGRLIAAGEGVCC